MTYKEKLLDPRWQKKRLEILNRDKFTCQNCGDTKSTLQIHHMVYTGKDPWDIPDELLITLCSLCHEAETSGAKEEIKTIGDKIKEKFVGESYMNIRVAFMDLHIVKSQLFTSRLLNLLLTDSKEMERLGKKYETRINKVFKWLD